MVMFSSIIISLLPFPSRCRAAPLGAHAVDGTHKVRPGGHPAGQLLDTPVQAGRRHHLFAEQYDGKCTVKSLSI